MTDLERMILEHTLGTTHLRPRNWLCAADGLAIQDDIVATIKGIVSDGGGF